MSTKLLVVAWLLFWGWLLLGCHPTVTLQLGAPSADRAAWEVRVTDIVKDHEHRLLALEHPHEPMDPPVKETK